MPILGASAAVLSCVIAFATLFPDREITLLVFFVLAGHAQGEIHGADRHRI